VPKMLRVGILAILVLLCFAPSSAQGSFVVQVAEKGALVYAGPSLTYPLISSWVEFRPVTILARNTLGTWIYGAGENSEGWTLAGYLILNSETRLSDVPISDMPDFNFEKIPLGTLTDLYNIPVIPDISVKTCEIFVYGQSLRRDAQVVSKVGDSNSASQYYLTPIGLGKYDLGAFDFLQTTVDWYGASFANSTQAAQVGMNALTVLDPLWAGNECQANESPLACEYRRSNASVAIIMFGINDIDTLNRNDYRNALRDIIDISIDNGVIPILVMFSIYPDLPNMEQALVFNGISAQVAQEKQTPIINFWAVAHDLPDNGVGADRIHLTQAGEIFRLGYPQSFQGLPLHNLTVLVTLDKLRQTCGIGEVAP
jgi:hypothetical protein